jgi:hypothetical protein
MSNKAKAKHRTRVMLPLCRHTKPRLHTHKHNHNCRHTHNVDSNGVNGIRNTAFILRKHKERYTRQSAHQTSEYIFPIIPNTPSHTKHAAKHRESAKKMETVQG